jgi:hypothetical protein
VISIIMSLNRNGPPHYLIGAATKKESIAYNDAHIHVVQCALEPSIRSIKGGLLGGYREIIPGVFKCCMHLVVSAFLVPAQIKKLDDLSYLKVSWLRV